MENAELTPNAWRAIKRCAECRNLVVLRILPPNGDETRCDVECDAVPFGDERTHYSCPLDADQQTTRKIRTPADLLNVIRASKGGDGEVDAL